MGYDTIRPISLFQKYDTRRGGRGGEELFVLYNTVRDFVGLVWLAFVRVSTVPSPTITHPPPKH